MCQECSVSLWALTVHIVEALSSYNGEGPVGGKPVQMDLIIAGSDPVATDSTACRVMGIKPHEISHIRLAYEKGMGEINHIKVLGERLEDVTRFFSRFSRSPSLQN